MIKPFTVVELVTLEDGVQRANVIVRKHERMDCGVRTHELRCVIFVPKDQDVNEFILADLKSQGWC
jgi:hypothetical protein